MQISKVEWQPPGYTPTVTAYALSSHSTTMIVVPERGGKIVSLYHLPSNKEWLWLNKELPWQEPNPADSYTAKHDLGGWDECFPTIASATVNGKKWPDHGDLWWRPWQARIEGGTLVMEVEGDGYRFRRSIMSSQDGFRLSYAVTNLTSEPFPYLWSAHPLLSIEPPVSVEIGGRPRVLLGKDGPLGKQGEGFRWPTIEGRMFDSIGKPSGLAVKLSVEMEQGEVLLSDQKGATLQFRWPLRALPWLGLWVNENGWSGTDLPPYCNLGVEPASGAPDSLEVALNDWESAQLLQPGERREWWLTIALGEDS
jgi:galactose mutarotase-like enzyme